MNPYVILGVLSIWLVSLAGVGFWQHKEGEKTIQVQWDKANEAQEKKIISLQEEAKKQEETTALAINSVATNYEEEKQNEKTHTDALISKLRSNALRLRDPGNRSSCSSVPNTSPNPSISGQTCDGRLSTRASEFLLELTKRANQTRDQLSACQDILHKDREMK